MKILFFMRSTVYVRNFESTLRLLADRGHRVHVVAETHQYLDPSDVMGRLCRAHPEITHSYPPTAAAKNWVELGVEVRKGIDYLRYFGPEYRHATKLRWRAEHRPPTYASSALWRRLVVTPRGRWLLGRGMRLCNRALRPDPAISKFIHDHHPDLVLVTPLVEPGSPQSIYLRSARSLGIRTGLCVYSWDNLTNKGLIHDPVDFVTVWNQQMKEEAATLHRVPTSRVVVTGAAAYDHWFSWKPRTSREEFCSRVGLDPQHPYLLYLCSSRFIAGNERPFVRRWVRDVRGASETLRNVGVLVRPHPQNADYWLTGDPDDGTNVVVWPRDGGNPADHETRADYYDSIYHSAAVVGINTSALIESGIVGRGVFTILAPEFQDTQDGTLHFRYLREVNGGLLHVASDITEHISQLETALKDPGLAADRCRRFVEAFVRPHGLDEAATPRLVAAIEATGAAGVRRSNHGPWWGFAVRPLLKRLLASVQMELRAAEKATDERRKAKQRDQEERAARRRAFSAARSGPAASTGLAPNASQEFKHYLHVREQVRRWLDVQPSNNGMTPSEHAMLAALAPLWTADPDAVARLRRCGETISGVRAADYDAMEGSLKARFKTDLRRLLARGDGGIWVDEPPVLGAFGISSDGKRFNEDTLRFFRMMSLLQDAALISEFRDSSTRRTVWEIGGGWGGFAYHFKTVCPNVTYLMTGRPELFLLSAVYLMTLFPNATFRFYDPTTPIAFWQDWGRVDFAFAPEGAVRSMEPASLDLTVDLMALERMSETRASMHVQRAYDLGSRYFASVCPVGHRAANGDTEIQPTLDRLYWLHPVCAPQSLARRLSLSASHKTPERTYFLGWKRLRV